MGDEDDDVLNDDAGEWTRVVVNNSSSMVAAEAAGTFDIGYDIRRRSKTSSVILYSERLIIDRRRQFSSALLLGYCARA
jgi:hypothetical protein